MDYYQIWCNLKESSKDLDFCENVHQYLGQLQEDGRINGFQITRRKLGFGPSELGEFNISILVNDLSQLEKTFQHVAARKGEIERLHHAVYSAVKDTTFALYRDFPDEVGKGS
ncbi:MAG: DUF6614 family protein [bacterium]